MRRYSIYFLILLAGCAAPIRVQEGRPLPTAATVPYHPPREMLLYVPQTDEAAAVWLKWFTQYPDLRMVIAMSPRFLRLAKDAHLKAQFQGLQKTGRLEIALQIPNAPILPLLLDTFSARDSLGPAALVPNPSYAYPEDVVQLIAQSKADFFRQWNFLPRGFIPPYGAASPKLISLLEKLGFGWIVAALQAPAADGPTQSGSMAVWDGAPSPPSPLPPGEGGRRPGEGTSVHVWDEREMRENPLEGWILKMKERKTIFFLPSDAGLETRPISPGAMTKERTWGQPDWSLWIGQPAKNAGWEALRKTREAVEVYKNSGQASVQRLDAAFSEIYSAQNSNYFASMGNTAQSPATVEEREHEFQATLSAVYRLIGQPPPDDLFGQRANGESQAVRPSSTTVRAEVLPDGREHVHITDAVGDALGGPSAPDLVAFDVWSSTESVLWSVTLASRTPAEVDIYVDLNGQPNAGTPTFLAGRGYTTSPIDAWEYALALSGQTAILYRTQGMGAYNAVQTFPIVADGNSLRVAVPRDLIRGSPRRWGYQVLVMTGDPATKPTISDFIDPLEISQKDLWRDLSTGLRTDIPFVRIRSK